ncbi:hypothetical protein QZH41_001337 [Actinostola sp. cb2023]|nr:hypothetical protein QZH41_001337 [Actinostola sp. cb2023]
MIDESLTLLLNIRDVSSNNQKSLTGTFGREKNNLWKPWSYQHRLQVVQKDEQITMPPKRQLRSMSAHGPKRSRSTPSSTSVEHEEASILPTSTSATEPRTTSLPDNLVERIVNQVVAKVTEKLSQSNPGIFGQSTSTSSLVEVPVVSSEQSTPMVSHALTNANAAQQTIASSLVEGSVAAVQSALTGEPNQLALPKELFSSPNLAIDARVSEKLQSKIWNNEYLDFSLLLSNPVLEGKYQLTVTTANNESSHALCLEPVSKSKKITSIETWISCFHIFVGVFTRKYPNEAPALMKYDEVVKDEAIKDASDEAFQYPSYYRTSITKNTYFLK